jgi:hypothetical protein
MDCSVIVLAAAAIGPPDGDASGTKSCREVSSEERLHHPVAKAFALRPFTQPHSGLRPGFWPEMGLKSVTLSIGTPLCPYPIAYRRAYGLSFRWTVLKNLRSPLCGNKLGLDGSPSLAKSCREVSNAERLRRHTLGFRVQGLGFMIQGLGFRV